MKKKGFKTMKKTIRILALSLLLCLCLSACGQSAAPAATQAPAATAAPAPESTPEPTEAPAPESVEVNILVLNGTTGFGMAKLMDDAAKDEASPYTVGVETDASNIAAALVSGECDIAALPTNAAAALYNKTQGGVRMLAINTRGVLYLVADTEKLSVNGWEDLEGRTVYAPAQNPSFIFKALADKAGADVTIDNTYAAPADLRTALAAGEVDLAVLPEPMVTIARAANEKLSPVMDLTEEWETVQQLGSLVQGCAVVRSDFAAEHPEAVAAFLADYGRSIDFLLENTQEAAQMIEQNGIFQKAAVAAKAVPNCNICFLTGEEMAEAMDSFCEAMFAVNPASVGGALPGEDFYYLG